MYNLFNIKPLGPIVWQTLAYLLHHSLSMYLDNLSSSPRTQ